MKPYSKLGIIEYGLVPFNVVDNESELTLLTGDWFFSQNDYCDSQDSKCDSASEKQIKGITITLTSCFC